MKKIIITVNPWQTRVAILREESLQNIYFSSPVSEALERSFFKGIVTKVLPGIQTAFVDIGQEKAGFLHISEIDRELALHRMTGTIDIGEFSEEIVEKQPRSTPDISKILREGEPILVQVSKEPVYEKGAKLTTCFTLPGRFIVLLPNIPRIAISKKIENWQERSRLKEILQKSLPEGMGAIIRTTSQEREEKEILQDVNFLVSTWNKIYKAYQSADAKAKIYEDLPIPLRIVRDNLDDDVEEVVVDDKETQHELYKFVKTIAPEHMYKVKYYAARQDIFDRFGINSQLQEALSEKVSLKSGGSIIIEMTQAMTVIDVNTGRYIGKANLEDTIFETNLEAAEEIVRQLRLRNIGGLIVIDFIDMSFPANRMKLLRFFEKTLRERDKFQSVVLRVSEFGLIEMTRKRSGRTLLQELSEQCPTCHGLGVIKSAQTICYELLPKIKAELAKNYKDKSVIISLHPRIFEYITQTEYNAILSLEKELKAAIALVSNTGIEQTSFEVRPSA